MKKIFFLLIVFTLFTRCSDNGITPPEIPTVPVDIPSDNSPAWSPDGKWIAYWHYDPNGVDSTYPTGLYLIDTTGNERTLVIEGNILNPDWSATSDTIIFHFRFSDLYKISIQERDLIQITQVNSAFFPSWSPDNKKIAFDTPFRDPKGANVIWIMNYDGSEMKDISEHGIGEMRDPDWSPNMKEIVYSGSHSANSESQIWVIDTIAVTTKRTQLTFNNYTTNRYPAWSPDGQKIAWSVTAPDIYYSDIWIMNADGTNQRRLTTGAYPSWSPDSKKLVFMKPLPDRSKGVLWFIDLQSMQIKQLTH